MPYPPTANTATVLPHTNRCADPLKNYLSCGTKCPGNAQPSPNEMSSWLQRVETTNRMFPELRSWLLLSCSIHSSKCKCKKSLETSPKQFS